jgi:4,5-DOPA dioxygenase extradiol
MNVPSGLPAVFIGHGSPMNTLERNRYTDAWADLGGSIPTPRAVLAISAHWYIASSAVTAMERPRVIHDFYGFPDELFAFDYPAPGSPDVAAEVVDTVEPVWVGFDETSWGLDHGTWSVLAHMFPRADVPVVQLSINALKPFGYHFDLGRRLAPLRDRGVLVVASGNVVHNLRRIDWSMPDAGFDWAHRFDAAARERMVSAPADVADLGQHVDFDLAVPTPDHFIPLLYIAGLADAIGVGSDVLVDGCAYGSLSMTAFTVGGVGINGASSNDPSAPLPEPDVVPPDNTNT